MSGYVELNIAGPLKLCAVLLYAEGFRPERNSAHYRTLAALPHILDGRTTDDAEYLETCRRKRNIVEYDRVGEVTEGDSEELVDFVDQLVSEVKRWLNKRHPELV